MISGSVIIVTYNSSELIAACLAALRAHAGWKVILVDNASADSTVEIAKAASPDICLIRNNENRGFAGAANQGFSSAETGICVLLNPDAIPEPGSLDKLAQALSAEKVGAAGGALTDDRGHVQIGFTVRRFPTLAAFLAELLLINRVWPGNPINRRYRCLDLDYQKLQKVDQPAGACLAVKHRAWHELGGFDESFTPAWFEDVDFCRRLRSNGWQIVYCPQALFRHSGAHSVSRLPFFRRQAFWYANLIRYFCKHHPRWQVRLLRAGVVCGLLLRCLLSLVGLRPSDVSARQALSAYWNVAWYYAVCGKQLPVKDKCEVITSAAT